MTDSKAWKIVATRQDAEEFTDSIGMIGAGWWRQIALAQKLGVPRVLGLTTEQWVNNRLGGYIKMAIAARREAVKELAAEGRSTREIEDILGIDHATAARDVVANATAGGKNSNENNASPDAAVAFATPIDAAASICTDVKIEAAIETGKNRDAKEKQRKADLERPVTIELVPGLHHGDFKKLSSKIEDNSVQLIFTDPPYDEASVPLYGDAARIAARILKPGGSFITYSGQRHILAVHAACLAHLDYWWMIAGVHDGGNNIMNKLGVRCGWKPLLWFVKGTRGDVQNVIGDVVSGGQEKSDHEWQQSVAEAKYYIEQLTPVDGLVVDFFAGSGTTAIAAEACGRKWIGFEINAATAEKASRRISGVAA
jgi:16S rRNA G966 N2-methylase RsmD